MAKVTQTLKYHQTIQSTPRAAYLAFSNQAALQEWLCDTALVDGRAGGNLYLAWRDGYAVTGQFQRLELNSQVAFTWQGYGEPAPSEVVVSFAPAEESVEVNLEHTFTSSEKKAKKQVKEFDKGWHMALENLKSVLESGQDLRITRRPFMGVYGLDPVTPAAAEQQNFGVDHGLRILGVVEGAPAHAAGLLKDDVLTRMGGERLDGPEAFQKFIGHHQAGDEVKVVFYRKGQKTAAQLVLGKRPKIDAPETAAELLKITLDAQSAGIQALAQALQGVKENEANYRVAASEWNAKEVLAHLIAEERDFQFWLHGLLDGQEVFEVTTHSNNPARIHSMTAANNRCRNLLSEVRRVQKETYSLVQAALPKLVERKGTFWRLGANLNALTRHFNDHIQQVETCLVNARRQANPTGNPTTPEPQVEP